MIHDRTIQLGNRCVGSGQPPFIAAEMSGNHNHSLERALQIVDAAAEAGAHSIKLQTYTADTMTMNVDRPEFYVQSEGTPWTGRHLYELYQAAYTPWEWHAPIFERAREHGLVPFSTPFDESAVDFLEELDAPFYKIASFENNHTPLIRKAARTGKPLIISTGMATLQELADAVDEARSSGCAQIMLLKCTSSYPANAEAANLATIPHMRELFDCPVGLSDHTEGIGVAVASTALGACFIEKHLTLDRADGGVDSDFSINPAELALLTSEAHKGAVSLGCISYGMSAPENAAQSFRRSIYFAQDCAAGHTVTPDDVRIIRPSNGIAPKDLPIILGQRLQCDAVAGTPVSWNHFKADGE